MATTRSLLRDGYTKSVLKGEILKNLAACNEERNFKDFSLILANLQYL